MIFDRHANLKYKYENRHFQARGYFVDTVGKDEKVIREYIQNQLQEDKLADQMSMKEFIDPFTGVSVKEGKGKAPFKGQAVKKVAAVISSENERLPQHNALIWREHTTSFRCGYGYIMN